MAGPTTRQSGVPYITPPFWYSVGRVLVSVTLSLSSPLLPRLPDTPSFVRRAPETLAPSSGSFSLVLTKLRPCRAHFRTSMSW